MPRNRSELPLSDTWRLEDIFQTNAEWEQSYARADASIETMAALEGKLGELPALKEVLDLLFSLDLVAGKLYAYARMRRDEDNTRTQYQALCDRALALCVRASTASAFIAPELLALPMAYLTSAKDHADFSDYRTYLRDIIRRKPHTLSAAEERIAAMAGELSAAPSNIFDMLTDADMKFPNVTNEDGEAVALTQSNYIPMMMSKDRRVRKDAFEALYQTYGSFGASIPAMYAASVKSDIFGARVSKFDSCLHAALFPDEVPISVYENLILAVRDHIPSLDRFVRLNAKMNGIDDPQMYDLYLPVSFGFDLNLEFDDAYALVCDCLGVLGEDYVQTLRIARNERWIDAHENEGKSSGAYSWGTYDSHPYVLLNHHNDLDGTQTIAHEMGHAMHTFYSNQAQPFPTSDYSLFVAEVASTVNEVLVLLELLERHEDPEAQAYLLYNLLDSYRTTVFRQTMFAEFEKISHAMAEGDVALTGESLGEAYAKLNAEYYPCVSHSPLIALEWMRIPHFYRAFYVYKYATGFSAATAIATKIRAEGQPAVDAYKRFLSAGSSLPPIEALKLAGIDMREKAPVERALSMFDELLAKYESVVSAL